LVSSKLENLHQVLVPSLTQAIEHSLKPVPKEMPLAVAVSGGPDSAMLAVHTAAWADKKGRILRFFHIHHGLQKSADTWANHVLQLGHLLGVPTWVKKVQVIERGDGVESAARRARYLGLSQMAETLKVENVLLGHHQNDQAETVLMRLFRGTGPAGMQAMQSQTKRANLTYRRPFLNVPRKQIIQAAKQFGQITQWQPVSDPTNINPKYTRGVIREHLAPILNKYWPQWKNTLARHAQLAAEQNQLLDELAADLLCSLAYYENPVVSQPNATISSFSLIKWRKLSFAKQKLVLRYFLKIAGLPMPSQAKTAEIQSQLQNVHQLGTDRRLQIKHGGAVLRCEQGRVLLQRYVGKR